MKEDNEKQANENFASRLKAGAPLVDDQLEDKIMIDVLYEESLIISNQKAKRRLRNRFIAAYCILTFAMITAGLWNAQVFIHFDPSSSDWHPLMNVPAVNYAAIIAVTASLSLFFFLAYWWQSKKVMHHFS